jgi:hypothetical protein
MARGGLRVIRVSTGLLADALGLPEGAKISHVAFDMYPRMDEISFVIESDEFEPVPAGCELPVIRPLLEKAANGRVEFVEWAGEGSDG